MTKLDGSSDYLIGWLRTAREKAPLKLAIHFWILLCAVTYTLVPFKAHAEGLSTFEYTAFVDFNVELCQKVKPQAAAQFELLRHPPYTCAARDLSSEKFARQRIEYKEFRQKLTQEFAQFSKIQRLEFCDSLFQTKC